MKPVPKPQAFGWFAAITLLSLLAVSWGAYTARAGTYNFYFNNTEQGDHSTATPQVSVIDGKGTGGQMGPKNLAQPDPAATPAPVPSEAAPAAVAATPASPPAVAQSVAQVTVPETPAKAREFRLLRLMITGGGMSEQLKHTSSSPVASGNVPYTYNSFSGIGPIGLLNFGINLSNRTTINAFGGYQYTDRSTKGIDSLAGLELETRPLHLTLFGHEDLLEAGILLGASTLHKAPGNMVSAHAGARINVNFTNELAFTIGGRANLGYVMADAGLSFRL